MNLLTTSIERLSKEESVRHIFGDAAQRVDSAVGGSNLPHIGALSEEPLYQIMVLVCLICYIVWIYRYVSKSGFRAFVGAASAFTRSRRKAGVHVSGSRALGDNMLLWGLIVSIYALFVTKFLEVADGIAYIHFSNFIGDTTITEQIHSVGLDRWTLMVVGGFFFVLLWSVAVLYFADYLSRSGTIFRSIFELRSSMLLYSVIYLVPVILFCAFGAYDSIRFYVALFLVVLFTLIYLIRSFLLFRSKKISILIWILYLCAVEIFPITLAWAIFTRS